MSITINDLPKSARKALEDNGSRLLLIEAPKGMPCPRCTFATKRMTSKGLGFGSVHSDDELREWTATRLDIRTAPLTLVFDETGVLTDQWTGVVDSKIEELAKSHISVAV